MSNLARDMFGPGSNLAKRYIPDNEMLAKKIHHLREADETIKVVLTSGTFDMTHIGHLRYLEKAKSLGHILVVGVDSDAKTRKRKGPHRPVVPEDERIEIVAHSRHADLITMKDEGDEKWQLIKLIKPDTLVVTQEQYGPDDLEQLKAYCGAVVVLEPQAETSTTANIRKLILEFADKARAQVKAALDMLHGQIDETFTSLMDNIYKKPKAEKVERSGNAS